MAFGSSGDPLGTRIQLGRSVDPECVLMVAVAELDLEHPSAVRLALHGVRLGLPSVEITHHRDSLSAGCVADKIVRPTASLGRIPVQRTAGPILRCNLIRHSQEPFL
jgi:hypothetical protein